MNAVCHRDYAASGSVQVRIYDDRLEVWNPGNLPPDLTLDLLYRPHRSRPRNKRIAEALFRAGLIEAWGTGTLRILRAYAATGAPPPQFSEEAQTFVVTLAPTPSPFDGSPGKPTTDALVLSPRQVAGMAYVREHGSISVPQYAALVGVSERQARADLRQLVEGEMLRSVGRGRATRYVSAG